MGADASQLIPNERIVYETRKHWASVVVDSVWPLLLLLGAIVLTWLEGDSTSGITGFFNRVIDMLRLAAFLVGQVGRWATATFGSSPRLDDPVRTRSPWCATRARLPRQSTRRNGQSGSRRSYVGPRGVRVRAQVWHTPTRKPGVEVDCRRHERRRRADAALPAMRHIHDGARALQLTHQNRRHGLIAPGQAHQHQRLGFVRHARSPVTRCLSLRAALLIGRSRVHLLPMGTGRLPGGSLTRVRACIR